MSWIGVSPHGHVAPIQNDGSENIFLLVACCRRLQVGGCGLLVPPGHQHLLPGPEPDQLAQNLIGVGVGSELLLDRMDLSGGVAQLVEELQLGLVVC